MDLLGRRQSGPTRICRLEGVDKPARRLGHGRAGDGDLGARVAGPHWSCSPLRP